MSSFQVAHSPIFIQSSTWAIENIIETPVDTLLDDPAISYINVFSLIFRFVVQLEKLFVKKKGRNSRKLGDDQYNLFRSLEKSLQRTGIDGKACLLRAICEMQQNPINHYSIMGEIATALLTPKRAKGNFMKDYLDAEYAGQADSSSCSSLYHTCPVSLFDFMRTYSTPADKPVSDGHFNTLPAQNSLKKVTQKETSNLKQQHMITYSEQ